MTDSTSPTPKPFVQRFEQQVGPLLKGLPDDIDQVERQAHSAVASLMQFAGHVNAQSLAVVSVDRLRERILITENALKDDPALDEDVREHLSEIIQLVDAFRAITRRYLHPQHHYVEPDGPVQGTYAQRLPRWDSERPKPRIVRGPTPTDCIHDWTLGGDLGCPECAKQWALHEQSHEHQRMLRETLEEAFRTASGDVTVINGTIQGSGRRVDSEDAKVCSHGVLLTSTCPVCDIEGRQGGAARG